MLRLLFVLFVLALATLVAILLVQIPRWLLERQRQKQLARYAPELLQHHNVPAPVVEKIVAQSEELETVRRVVRDLLADSNADTPVEYAIPLEEWLKNQPRRLDR